LQTNTRAVLAEVSAVDLTRRAVIADGRPILFDKLIIATGARHAYFGHDEWEAHAPGLKRIDDAIALRGRILLAAPDASSRGPISLFPETLTSLSSAMRPLPCTAPVAEQQGAYIAAKILAELQGKTATPLRHRDFGSLATIGHNTAVVEIGRLRLTRSLAWIPWCVAHVDFPDRLP
jgi:NADH dehydrogenase FAD-containing subunit